MNFHILFILVITCLQVSSNQRNIICYYLHGYGVNIAPPESLNTTLCTHINYAFAKLDVNGTLIHQRSSVDVKHQLYARTLSLKKTNSDLKVLISIGDTNASTFSTVSADPKTRQRFVNSSVDFLKAHNFDGIDVDWELPYSKDADNFVLLLKELKEAFNDKNWLLTVAVYPNPSVGYKVTEIMKYVDMINLMCYNYYGPWSAYTGHNAALFSSPIESAYEKIHLNTAASLQNWMEAGATKSKINVGIPFYGRTFTLVNADDHSFHSPIVGGGRPSTPSYKQICKNFNNYSQVWDDEQQISYKYYKDQWLSYDEERSVAAKAKFIKSQGVAGAMIWQIGQDDINGECGPKQGLLQTVYRYLNKEN
ncbi:probable chitinase 10 [Diorhabda sublineata]|uniref:probable chitinase 10 n=1 Tax=Diorhabda sublineata TaxID=1163346 RepID=UPI0024E05E2F|nr:probable chitinase 10 [Diorhabda sublineata]